MSLNNIIFIDNLPTLDLHGFEGDVARVYINDFINDNYKMKNEFVVIIHGIGKGIIKEVTKDVLSRNKRVIDFKLYPYNVGCTIVHIDLTK